MKNYKIIVALLMIICVMTAVCACTGKHQHDYSADWTSDAKNHWHACNGEGCEEIAGSTAHSFDEGVVTTPATEEAEGVLTKKCSVCGYEKTEAIAKLPVGHKHELQIVEGVAPTCVDKGIETYYTCSCGSKFSDAEGKNEIAYPVVVDATGHTEVVIPAIEASCTESGKTEGKYCSVCEEILVSQNLVSAKGHQNVVSAAKDPTCTENGRTAGVACSVCGVPSSTQNVVPALGHDWDDGEITTSSTCSVKGVKTYNCARCEETKTEELALDNNAHSWNEGEITTPSTCTVKGLKTYTCSACGGTKTEAIDLDNNAHSWADATCEVAKTCSACKITEGEALGHDYEKTASVAPTCTVPGSNTYVCKNDSAHTYTESVDALNHDIVIDVAVAPKCTETGLTEGQHCSRCDGATVVQNTVPAAGHKYDNASDAECNVCGEIRDVACTHASTEKIPGKAATCTATGLTDGEKCLACGEIVVNQTIIDAKGHTEAVDAAVAATCTTTGLTEGKHCSVCSTVLVAQTVTNALGHTEVIDKAVAPTCVATGLTEGKHCSVCNVVFVAQTEIAKTSHTWGDAVVTVEGAVGTVTYTCQVCEATEQLVGPVAQNKHVCDHLVSGVETEYGKWTACSVCGAKSYAATALSAYKGSGATHSTVDVFLPKEGGNPTVAADMVKQSVKVSDVAITYNITSGADKDATHVDFVYTITATEKMTVNVFFNGRSTNVKNNVNTAAQINKFMEIYQGDTKLEISDSAVLPAYREGYSYWTEQQVATVELEAGDNTFTFRFTKNGGKYNNGKYYGAYASYFRFAEASKIEEGCEDNVHELVPVTEVAPNCFDGMKAHYACATCDKLFDLETKAPTEAKYLVIPAIFTHVFENVPRLQADGTYAYQCTRGCGVTKAHTCTGEGKYLVIAKEPNQVWYEDGDSFNPDRMELYLSTACAEGCSGNTVIAGHLIGYEVLTYTYQNGDSFKAGDEYITINYKDGDETLSVNLPVTVTAVGGTITVDDSDEGFSFVDNVSGKDSGSRTAGHRTNDTGRVGQSAYGGSYVNNFDNGDTATFKFTLDEAANGANIVLRASSERMNGAGGTPPRGYAISVNDVVIIKIDGQIVEFSDDVILKGSVDTLEQTANRWVWTNWMNLDLGTYDLAAGEHTVEIIIDTTLSASVAGTDANAYTASIQLDCLNVFLGE